MPERRCTTCWNFTRFCVCRWEVVGVGAGGELVEERAGCTRTWFPQDSPLPVAERIARIAEEERQRLLDCVRRPEDPVGVHLKATAERLRRWLRTPRPDPADRDEEW